MSSGDFQPFNPTYETAPRFNASLHTLWPDNMSKHALRWEMILHANAGELDKDAVLYVLQDKIACFLYDIVHLFGLASYPARQEWYQCSRHPPTRSGATVRFISHMQNM
jgi:hypothetical protein